MKSTRILLVSLLVFIPFIYGIGCPQPDNAWYPPTTNPDLSNPEELSFCYRFEADGEPSQCGGATGVHCVPLNTWTDAIHINTNGSSGGCEQQFSLQKSNPVTESSLLQLCVDIVSDGLAQCDNAGLYCVNVNEWTTTFRFDMDDREGGLPNSLLSQKRYLCLKCGIAGRGQ